MAIKQTELGIGTSSIVDYRNQVVDYLPWMFVYELSMTSQRPGEVASYDTLIYPFDSYIWKFITLATLVTFSYLLATQKLWNNIHGGTLTPDIIFRGI